MFGGNTDRLSSAAPACCVCLQSHIACQLVTWCTCTQLQAVLAECLPLHPEAEDTTGANDTDQPGGKQTVGTAVGIASCPFDSMARFSWALFLAAKVSGTMIADTWNGRMMASSLQVPDLQM